MLPRDLLSASLLSSLILLLDLNSVIAQTDDNFKKRCQTRLAISFLGDTEPLSSDEISKLAEGYLTRPEFIEHFSRFINAEFNEVPGDESEQDAPYHVVKEVLNTNKPFRDLFIGPYRVEATGNNNNRTVQVVNDPNGYGYFTSEAWVRRYAGDEEDGLRIVAAYRILNNILGTELTATTNAPDADVSANGRASPGCRGCHFDNWFALDPISEVLSRVQRDNMGMVTGFAAPTPQQLPETVLGGFKVSSEKEMIQKMVDSEEFKFHACRLTFKFLYGREENSCETSVFDQCMQAFTKSGMIQDALRAVATDSSFCQ